MEIPEDMGLSLIGDIPQEPLSPRQMLEREYPIAFRRDVPYTVLVQHVKLYCSKCTRPALSQAVRCCPDLLCRLKKLSNLELHIVETQDRVYEREMRKPRNPAEDDEYLDSVLTLDQLIRS